MSEGYGGGIPKVDQQPALCINYTINTVMSATDE